MALEFLEHCSFTGSALPEPFVQFELEKELIKANLLPKTVGKEGEALQESWNIYRRKLRELASIGGALRVRNQVIEPLRDRLGYASLETTEDVETREGRESGGYLMYTSDLSTKLRVWCTDMNIDLDAPAKRGSAYRYSHLRIAQRVLLASGERLGLLTNGAELRLLISDPARPDSQVTIAIDPHWKRSRNVPASYLLVLALASPSGVKALTSLVDKARLQQARVTKDLRVQARQAVEQFVQEVLDRPDNRELLAKYRDRQQLAKALWREGLIIIYRLLFILKLESSDDPAQSFSFASTSLWRNTYSPSGKLTWYVRKVLDEGAETGHLLENGLRGVFRMFTEGVQCTELNVKPLGGALFGADATPVLSELQWGERAIAVLLDRLLWTSKQRGANARERVHYGPLNVEDLGRVYEALLELEPGISTEPMCRLRRQKLEVVVPVAQGLKYRPPSPPNLGGTREQELESPPELGDLGGLPEEELEEEETEEEATTKGKKTKVEWIEEIPPDRFYLRVGLGRKASGSYYTPHSFVRFLVQETLGALVTERSPQDNPDPCAILKLKVLDPAMGSGHFLVEACRFLGEKLYEACRLCDDRAIAAEQLAERAAQPEAREAALAEARLYRQRVIDLPDPDDKLVKYLPSSAPEGLESGYSQTEALALCRRLVAVHCLYGVDKNPLAVELAKLSLWIESHAEGLPLTFLDHRLVLGDSLTGAFFSHLLKEPLSQDDVQKLLYQDINQQFRHTMSEALRYVQDLEASVGISLSDLIKKEAAKASLDRAFAPFKVVAAAWSGGVMLGKEGCDDLAYSRLAQVVGSSGDLPESLADQPKLLKMIAKGLGVAEVSASREELLALLTSGVCVPAFPYDLTFAEVFYPDGNLQNRQGFDVVLGNPPWDAIQFKSKEFLAAFDFEILDAPTKREREKIEKILMNNSQCSDLFEQYKEEFEELKRCNDLLYEYQKVRIDGDLAGRQLDAFRVFMERNAQVLKSSGLTGVIVPSAFHANEGATGVRQLYLENMALKCCYSFENRKKLFEIHLSFKFAAVVAQKGQITVEFPCAFYLHDDQWLFENFGKKELLIYSYDFIQKTGGDYLTFVELQTIYDLEPFEIAFSTRETLSSYCSRTSITPNTSELPMLGEDVFFPANSIINDTDVRFPEVAQQLLNKGFVPLHEGKTFHQFTDYWSEKPRYVVKLDGLKDRPRWLNLFRYYRFLYRAISSSTNERTGIATIVPPPCVNTRKAASDITADLHPISDSLLLCSVFNSFTFDYLLRSMVQTDVSLFIVYRMPFPDLMIDSSTLLGHSTLRLICNHSGYASLWHEQLGTEWREPNREAFTYPVLETEDQRWQIRSAIDAVVAAAYGLTRAQYAHVLSTFSHKSYLQAPHLCLNYFDELQAIGLETFTRKYDPYWDIPLNENLPQPVIDLPIPITSPQDSELFDTSQHINEVKPKKRKSKK